jgi:hypothetical protein
MQINDFCDIASVFALIYIMNQMVSGPNAFKGLPKDMVDQFFINSACEIALELFISLSFPILVRRMTKYKGF